MPKVLSGKDLGHKCKIVLQYLLLFIIATITFVNFPVFRHFCIERNGYIVLDMAMGAFSVSARIDTILQSLASHPGKLRLRRVPRFSKVTGD
jgi:hypothetical protein